MKVVVPEPTLTVGVPLVLLVVVTFPPLVTMFVDGVNDSPGIVETLVLVDPLVVLAGIVEVTLLKGAGGVCGVVLAETETTFAGNEPARTWGVGWPPTFKGAGWICSAGRAVVCGDEGLPTVELLVVPICTLWAPVGAWTAMVCRS
jgi:hypothetical protein